MPGGVIGAVQRYTQLARDVPRVICRDRWNLRVLGVLRIRACPSRRGGELLLLRLVLLRLLLLRGRLLWCLSTIVMPVNVLRISAAVPTTPTALSGRGWWGCWRFVHWYGSYIVG